VKTTWAILRETFSKWDAHEAPRLGAALAFYTILSLAPLMIVVIAITALVFGHSAESTVV
jgi:membrane protein